MLTIITPNDDVDLLSLDAVKAELGITGSASDDQLEDWITQASEIIAGHCNRVFAIETVSESVRSRAGCGEFVLSRYPIVEVISAANGDTALPIDNFAIDKRTGCGERVCGDGWSSGWPRTTITYRAGYELPDGAPSAVRRAAMLLVKQYYASDDLDPLVRSETVEGVGSTTYFNVEGSGLPPEVEGLLSDHRATHAP